MVFSQICGKHLYVHMTTERKQTGALLLDIMTFGILSNALVR